MTDRGPQEIHEATSRQYRRGALLGMTMAEAFILISFALLLLLAAWKAKSDEEIDRYRQIETLTPEQVRVVADMTNAGRLEQAGRLARSASFETLDALERNGVDIERLAEIATDIERWRLIDKDELVRILEGAKELPDDIQRDLADLVEIEDTRGIIEILKITERTPENDLMRERLAGIGAQLDAARDAEADLIQDMQRTLGGLVAKVGGYIDENGAVVVRDSILFDVGSPDLTERMEEFLEELCVPWMQVMMRSPVSVAGAQVEGHASSEWEGRTVQEAYLKNLDLSQGRAATVLRQCLLIASRDSVDEGVETWARAHLRAVGFSSARPVMDETGAEVPEQSRRVVFSLDLDQERLIEDLEGEVGQVRPIPARGQAAADTR